MNTAILGLDRYGLSKEDNDRLVIFNTVFTWIFIGEFSFKIIGLGPVKYLKDRLNYLDGIVVVVSIAELVILDGSLNGAH